MVSNMNDDAQKGTPVPKPRLVKKPPVLKAPEYSAGIKPDTTREHQETNRPVRISGDSQTRSLDKSNRGDQPKVERKTGTSLRRDERKGTTLKFRLRTHVNHKIFWLNIAKLVFTGVAATGVLFLTPTLRMLLNGETVSSTDTLILLGGITAIGAVGVVMVTVWCHIMVYGTQSERERLTSWVGTVYGLKMSAPSMCQLLKRNETAFKKYDETITEAGIAVKEDPFGLLELHTVFLRMDKETNQWQLVNSRGKVYEKYAA